MNVLIIGSGGREHALAWKIAHSTQVTQVYIAPGNAGTALEKKCSNVAINVNEHDKLIDFVKKKPINLTIVGPEVPLVNGIVDRFQAQQLAIFGPTKGASQLEGSKRYSKEFFKRYHIPSAAYRSFTNPEAAHHYLTQVDYPIVIKADGLAAGKGVLICATREDADITVENMLTKKIFGTAGEEIIIEEYLVGEEVSFMVMVDGDHILPLATAQDHKARDNGDLGPNTGGMGAYSPAPIVSETLHQRIMQTIIEPTVAGLAKDGHPYTGFLYAGLMIRAGDIKVLEYNCRLGDPETQAILYRLQSDLYAHCMAAVQGRLNTQQAIWDERIALGVVMAAGGYPAAYRCGDEISGLPAEQTDIKVFHAGTQTQQGKLITAGGRVLAVCALAQNYAVAKQKAYAEITKIHWSNLYYRTDIGDKAMCKS